MLGSHNLRAVRPEASLGSVYCNAAVGIVRMAQTQRSANGNGRKWLWRIAFRQCRRTVRNSQRHTDSANADAAEAYGDVLQLAKPLADESRNMRCLLAKEARCKRDALHACAKAETCCRAKFGHQDCLRPQQSLPSGGEIDSFLLIINSIQNLLIGNILHSYISVTRPCRLYKIQKHLYLKSLLLKDCI